VTVYHPERLITEARSLALSVAPKDGAVWALPQGPLTGMLDRAQDELKAKGLISDHDELIGDKIKAVFARPTSFEDALARERDVFLELCQKALTQARIRHMLETGKPLRN
jgi:3-hydroxyacyl-CoA dehydrogenase